MSDSKKQEETNKVTDRLRNLCSRREYCSSDILKKATTYLEGEADAAEKVLQTLVSEKYVSDLRYATAYAREKAMISGWGDTKIRYMLSGKRIPRDIISQALAEIDEEKADLRLKKLLENKARTLKADPQIRLKLLRFALGRGYQYDDVAPVIDSLMRK
jgi:regulatory protein